MLIYNYRSRDRQQQTTALACRRRTKVSWEFIARILVFASREKMKISENVQNLHLQNIYSYTHRSFSVLYIA